MALREPYIVLHSPVLCVYMCVCVYVCMNMYIKALTLPHSSSDGETFCEDLLMDTGGWGGNKSILKLCWVTEPFLKCG